MGIWQTKNQKEKLLMLLIMKQRLNLGKVEPKIYAAMDEADNALAGFNISILVWWRL